MRRLGRSPILKHDARIYFFLYRIFWDRSCEQTQLNVCFTRDGTIGSIKLELRSRWEVVWMVAEPLIPTLQSCAQRSLKIGFYGIAAIQFALLRRGQRY